MFSYKIVIVPPHSPPIVAAQQTSNLENFLTISIFSVHQLFPQPHKQNLDHDFFTTKSWFIRIVEKNNRITTRSRTQKLSLFCCSDSIWSLIVLSPVLGSVRVSVLSFVILNFYDELSQIEEHGQRNDYNIPGKGKTSYNTEMKAMVVKTRKIQIKSE